MLRRRFEVAYYAFINPITEGKVEAWKGFVKEMTGPRSKELKESRKKVGLTMERIGSTHSHGRLRGGLLGG